MDFDIDDLPVDQIQNVPAVKEHGSQCDSHEEVGIDEFEDDDFVIGQEAPDLTGNIPNVMDHNPALGAGGIFCYYLLKFHAYQKGVMFFGYAGKGLLKYEKGTNRQHKWCKGSVQKKVKTIILALVFTAVFFSIVHPYLSLLGTEKSQSMEAVKRTNLTYNVTELPQLFPVHQFAFFEKRKLHDQMACSLKDDPAECWNLNERRCISKGITTKEYHRCIIKLLKEDGQNATQFCEDHYGEMRLWQDPKNADKSPETLQYYQMKYDCLKTSGKKHGKQYCKDINKYTPGTTIQDLFACYMRFKVDYGVEFCEYNFPNDELKLVKCFNQKGVPLGPRACEIIHRGNNSGLIECYDKIPHVDTRVCDLKYAEFNWDNATVQQCYKNGSYTLDKKFCETNYNNMDDIYDCYERIGLDSVKDRVFCERKFVDDVDGKYDCLESLGRPKLGEYCYQKFYQEEALEDRYECLAQQNIPKTAAYCSRKFQALKDEAKEQGVKYDMTAELDCIFGLGIPKFSTKCEVPSDPAIDKEEMKILVADYKQSKTVALAKKFLDEFPPYYFNLAQNRLDDQYFQETNYAQFVMQNPQDYFYKASSFISKRGQVVGIVNPVDTMQRRAIGKIALGTPFKYNDYEMTLHTVNPDATFNESFPFPGFSNGIVKATKGDSNEEIEGTWDFLTSSDHITIELSDGLYKSFKFVETTGDNGDLNHLWKTADGELTMVQKHPFRSNEQILKCDVSPSYNGFSGLEELVYEVLPFDEPQEINTVSFFAPNDDMSAFSIFIGDTTNPDQFDYCNMVPSKYDAGTRITLKCENPVKGNKVMFVRNKSVFSITGLKNNKVTICQVQINGVVDFTGQPIKLTDQKATFDFYLGADKLSIGQVVVKKDEGKDWAYDAGQEDALKAVTTAAFINDKAGGMMVGSPLHVVTTHESYFKKDDTARDPTQYNYKTEFNIDLKADNVIADTVFQYEFNLGDMISELKVDNLNATFVDMLKVMTYTGQQIYENDTLLDDHEGAHNLHQEVKAGFSYSACFLNDIYLFQNKCKSTYAKEPENRHACLYQLEKEGEGFSSPIGRNYCMNKQESVSDMFAYKLTNKYQCLNDDNINPIPIEYDKEVQDCFLGITDQYLLEQCLKEYESIGPLVFKEKPEPVESANSEDQVAEVKEDEDDDEPKLYYGLAPGVLEKRAEEIRKAEEALRAQEAAGAPTSAPSVPGVQQPVVPINALEYYVDKKFDGKTYDFDDQYEDYVCSNTNMSFYQNPQALNPDSPQFNTYDTRIYLLCSTFEMDNQIVAHFYMPDLDPEKWKDRQLLVNRTEYSQAYFQTTYEKELEFIMIDKVLMHTGDSMPKGKISKQDYSAFLQDAKTTQLYEQNPQTITEDFLDPVNIKAFSKTSIRLGQIPTFYIFNYAFMFRDNNGTAIAMKPLENKVSPYRVPTEKKTQNTIMLDFQFTEEIWTYRYYQFIDIVEALGGIGNAIGVFMAEISMLFIWLFFLDMIRVIYSRYKHDWTIVRNEQLMENLSTYKKVIKQLQQNPNATGHDLEKEGGNLDGALTKKGEGETPDIAAKIQKKLTERLQKNVNSLKALYEISQEQLKQDLEDLEKIHELEKIDQNEVMEPIHHRYGLYKVEGQKIVKNQVKKEAWNDKFDDKYTKLAITRKRMGQSLHQIATQIKRRVTFYSLYEYSDDLELLKAQHELLKEQLRNNIAKIQDRQRAIEDKFSDHVPSEENSLKALNQNDDLTSFISQTEVNQVKIVDDINSNGSPKHQKQD